MKFFLFILLFFGFQNHNEAKISLSKLFGDNMVMQRDQKINVWGTADYDERIVVTFLNRTYRATPDDSGKWLVTFSEMETGGPFEMIVAGMEDKIVVTNILIGDVWICSGQSNMEWSVKQSDNAKQEIQNAKDNQIRHFKIPHAYSEFPVDTLSGGVWLECSSESVGDFTAVGYYFAKELRKHQDVPIGILNCSWGASKIQAWMDGQSLGIKNSPFSVSPVATYLEEEKEITRTNLLKQLDTLPLEDMGKLRNVPVWAQLAYPDNDWKTMNLPVLWETEGFSELDGVVWFRKEIFLSKEEAQNSITLNLGKIDDSDSTYLNGKFVGSMSMAYDKIRTYKISSSFLKEGKNMVTVWVDDVGRGGGIYGEKETLFYESVNGKKSLSGAWKFKVGKVYLNKIKEPNKIPTLLFNGMIKPIQNFPVKGVLWYQGEANANKKEVENYQFLFPKMISLWRKIWNTDLPFLWVQLANFQSITDDPNRPSNWAVLRASQSKALDLENTGQAIAIDIGDTWDIHPKNKQEVGRRLSLIARKVAYQEDIVFSGPVYESMILEGNKIRLKFKHIGSGIIANDSAEFLESFIIAGKNRKFEWAKATIEGDEIIVWSDKVKNPKAVRYAWSNNPEKINFYNKEGLPAAPFRTDDW